MTHAPCRNARAFPGASLVAFWLAVFAFGVPVASTAEQSRVCSGDIVKSCVWSSGGALGLRGVFCNLDAVLEGDSSDDIG